MQVKTVIFISPRHIVCQMMAFGHVTLLRHRRFPIARLPVHSVTFSMLDALIRVSLSIKCGTISSFYVFEAVFRMRQVLHVGMDAFLFSQAASYM